MYAVFTTDYSVEFADHKYTVFNDQDADILSISTRIEGQALSRSATVSFIRNDNGSEISDLVISEQGISKVDYKIPNNSKTGNRVFNVTLVTSDVLIEIGSQSTISIHVIDDCKLFKFYVYV